MLVPSLANSCTLSHMAEKKMAGEKIDENNEPKAVKRLTAMLWSLVQRNDAAVILQTYCMTGSYTKIYRFIERAPRVVPSIRFEVVS